MTSNNHRAQAMVLAAGLGKRMRPITDTMPKPLVPVAGKPMLDHVLDKLAAAGFDQAVVNCHYLGQMIVDHVATRPAPMVVTSPEVDLLETGGGVKKALPLLDREAILIANADVFWTEGREALFDRLISAFDPDHMDALLAIYPVADGYGYDGAGDFFWQVDGRLKRRGDAPNAPYFFTGVQILSPRLFENTPDGAFSLNVVYDKALAKGRCYGLVHDGGHFHIGTPEALSDSEPVIARALEIERDKQATAGGK
ncbi:nucleotidyltransferase family protein [uncultured Thalassospira sp.]|uniref:nucleotidyltransferase family protein n=1 Tax=uncultured Thalassospira sp. TaxID=404382 RepID=UPI0025933DA0|nr:nucleotidyltransferase family protein [uncultured Thalassospira sp.]